MKSKSVHVIRVLALPLLFAAGPLSSAIAGPAIEVRGELTNLKRAIVEDGRYDFLFSVYDAKDGGAIVWQEPRDAVEVHDGKYSRRRWQRRPRRPACCPTRSHGDVPGASLAAARAARSCLGTSLKSVTPVIGKSQHRMFDVA